MFRSLVLICLCVICFFLIRGYLAENYHPQNSRTATYSRKNRAIEKKVPSDDSPTNSDPYDQGPPPIQINAPALLLEYEANEIAADQKYKGHLIEVTGMIASIRKDFTDQAILDLSTYDRFRTVDAYLNRKSVSYAANLSRGETVTVLCQGDGFLLESPMLKDCSIK